MMKQRLERAGLKDLWAKIEAGVRLEEEDGLRLFASQDFLALGHLANLVRERKNGNKTYYVVNRHINYTNVCKNGCLFCAYSKKPDEEGSYTMSLEQIMERAEEAASAGATELHIVGGAHPSLPFDYYREMMEALHEAYPHFHLQAFTAVEIAHMAEVSGLSVEEVLKALKDSGLGSLPGGGAEVFSPRMRELTCPEKLPPDGWLEVMRKAHLLGLRSNATMLYGLMETDEERVDHLLRLRALQDETGGFMSFIPLSFHPSHTQFSHLPFTTAFLDLKVLAISRLLLDNFDHIKAFWVMLGPKLAQVSQSFGVDDLDGTVVEERITHSAGALTPEFMPVQELRRLIEEAGREPMERDTIYRPVLRGATHFFDAKKWVAPLRPPFPKKPYQIVG